MRGTRSPAQRFPGWVCAVLTTALLGGTSLAQEFVLHPLPLPSEAAGVTESRLSPGDVVLRRIRIQPGDTLWDLSRRYLGNPWYYPQFLVYNAIEHPDRIYAGHFLLVPVGRVGALRGRIGSAHWRVMPPPAAGPSPGVSVKPAAPGDTEEAMFRQARRLVRQGACREALAQLETFLQAYPRSAFRLQALLAKADCHRRLAEEP